MLGMTSMEMTALIAALVALLTALTALARWWVRGHATQPGAGDAETTAAEETLRVGSEHATSTSDDDTATIFRK